MITTFYADRPGHTRPALVARVATDMAAWAHRVLCIDWDLSGDGVSGLLNAPPAAWGLVDLVRDGGDTRPLEAYPTRLGTLDIIRPYGTRSRPGLVDWLSLHRNRDLGDYLESCAEQWRQEYDAVLIDGPGGTGPAAGICLAHLPDAVVPLVAPGRQEETRALLDRIAAVRDRLPYDRGRLLAIPRAAEAELVPELATVLEAWADRNLPLDRLADVLAGPTQVLAALLARELEDNAELRTPETTEQYVGRAAAGSPRAAERLVTARRAAREALEDVLVAILPAEDWAELERSVLALRDTLDGNDPGTIAAAIRRLPAADSRVRGPRGTAIPDGLRATVSTLLKRLA